MARRFRRWVVRPLVWTVAFLGLVVAVAWLLARSEYVQARLRVLVETRLEEFVGREISIGAARFSFLPLSVEARDVEIAGDRPGAPPFATVPRLSVEADVFGWRRPVVAVRSLQIEEPRLQLEFYPDGTSNVPKLRFRRREQGSAGGRFKVRVDALSVTGGTLMLGDRRLPLDLEARGVEGELLGAGGTALQGRAAARWVDLTLPRARPVAASVAADLWIDRGRIDVRSAHIEAPALSGDVTGTIRWGEIRSTELAFTARGSTELLYAMGYLSGPEQASGQLEIEGDYAWRPEGWGYRAAVRSDAATILERPLTQLAGRLEGDRAAVRFELDGAEYRGGHVTGDLLVDLTTPERPTALRLELRDVDAGAALPDQGVPIEALGARAGGSFGFRFPFSEPERGEGEGTFHLVATSRAGRRLPLGGDVGLQIHAGQLALPPFVLAADGQRVRVEGGYDLVARRGRFHVEAQTERVGDLAVFLPPAPAGEPEPAWLPTAGRGAIEADVEVMPAGPSARLALDLSEVRAPGLRAARAHGTMRVDERWVQDLRLRIEQPDGALVVAGRIPLADETGRLAGPMEVAVESSAWSLDNALAWLPEDMVDWPLRGLFSGSIRLRGVPEDPSGEVMGALNPAVLYDVGVGALIAALSFDPRGVALRDLRWDSAAGLVTAAGAIDLERETMDIRFRGAGLDLARAPFSGLAGGRVRGALGVEGTLGGTLERPSLRAELGLTELGVGSESATDPQAAVKPRWLGRDGTGAIAIDWREDRLAVEASIPELLEFNGDGLLRWGAENEAALLDLVLDVQAPDLGAAARVFLAAPPADVSGRLAGRLRLHGPLDRLALEAELPAGELVASGHRLAAQEPLRLQLVPEGDGSRLSITSLFLAEAGSANELIVAGDVVFDPADTRFDLRLQAALGAEWLEAVAPALDARGALQVLAALHGTAAAPELTGQAEAVDARVVIEGFPHAFDDLRVVLLAYPGEIVIDDLRARLAGGTLRASGSLRLPGGEAGDELTYRVQARAEDVALRYPEGWLVRGDVELVLSSQPGGRQIRGVADLESAVYLRDIDVGLAQLLRGFFARQRLQVAETEEFLATTFLNVAVHAPGALRVSNNVAKLRGSADLTLRGTLASPVVFGHVEAEPGGELVYGDNEYEVTRARLSFANPYRIEPLIDLEAHSRVSQYDVRLELVGPLDRLNATFTSDPPIPDLEILSLIATGDTSLAAERPGLGPAAGGEAGLAGAASVGAEAFLAGQAASLVGERVNRLFRFDRFRVAPLAASGESISAVRVTAGEQISKDLYVTYSINPLVTEDQVLSLEWSVARNLSLIFTQNGDGTYAVDAQWAKAF